MKMLDSYWQPFLARLPALGIVSLTALMLASCGVQEKAATIPAPAAASIPAPKPAPPAPAPKSTPGATLPAPEEKTGASAAPPNPGFEKHVQKKKSGGKPVAPPESATPAPAPRTQLRAPAAANGASKGVPADLYAVKVGADPVLRIPGPPGELRVWIGYSAYEPEYKDLKSAVDTLPAEGKTAMVTPFAPGLKVEPNKSICMKTNPKGSEVMFTLTPIESGSFKVGAEVALFDTADCSGAPIPKATTTLRVEVSADRAKLTTKYVDELWQVFWEKLLEFWGVVVALIFAGLLFLLRKKLKQWFGFTG